MVTVVYYPLTKNSPGSSALLGRWLRGVVAPISWTPKGSASKSYILSPYKRLLILRYLVDDMGILATARLADVSKKTVLKLFRDVGLPCFRYQKEHLRDLECRHIEGDEVWSFLYTPKSATAPR